MSDQLGMFTITYHQDDPPPQTNAQTCQVCRIETVYTRRDGREALYCGSGGCTSRKRRCKTCGSVFTMNVGQAGTRYCCDACRPDNFPPAKRQVPCAHCGHEYLARTTETAQVCARCRKSFANQIRTHKLPTEWALRLITAVTCACCGDRLRMVGTRHDGVVDHDHGCCPSKASCGKCVRGIICSRCNTVAGSIESEPRRYAMVMNYLGMTMTVVT